MRCLGVLCFVPVICGSVISQTKHEGLPRVQPVTAARLKEIVRKDSGRVVLVNAWASWCKPCHDEMPALLKLRSAYPDTTVDVILVAIDDSEIVDSVVRPHLKAFGVDFLSYVARDRSDDAFIEGMNPGWNGALPATFVYDKKGALVEMMVGERSYGKFQQAILKALRR